MPRVSLFAMASRPAESTRGDLLAVSLGFGPGRAWRACWVCCARGRGGTFIIIIISRNAMQLTAIGPLESGDGGGVVAQPLEDW